MNVIVGDSRKAYLGLCWRHTVGSIPLASAMIQFDVALLEEQGLVWVSSAQTFVPEKFNLVVDQRP